MTTDRLLTAREVADHLGTSVRFVYDLIETERIEFVRLGRLVRIRQSILSELIRDGTVPPSRAA